MRERGRKRERHRRIKEKRKGEIKVVLGISIENAPVTSKAGDLLKDGHDRLSPKHN